MFVAFSIVACILATSFVTGDSFDDRGVGLYGLKLSSFCGPIFQRYPGSASPTIPIIKFSFLLREVQISSPLQDGGSTVDLGFRLSSDGMEIL